MNKQGIIPFSNGTDYQCWLYANCEKCHKYHNDLDDNGYSQCEIEKAIAHCTCGISMTEEMVKRMGGVESEKYPGCYNFSQQCTEFQPLQ